MAENVRRVYKIITTWMTKGEKTQIIKFGQNNASTETEASDLKS